MIKKSIILLLLVGAVSMSCSRLEKDLFPEGPSRVENSLKEYRDLLCGAEHGWAVAFFPNPDKYGAFYFTMKFNAAGQVVMVADSTGFANAPQLSDKDTKKCEPVTSLYSLKVDQGALIKFDTYNYLHVLADPLAGPAGTAGLGYEGDIEFVIDRVSADKDSIITIGKKRHNKVVFTRLKEPSSNYLSTLEGMMNNIIRQKTYFREYQIGEDVVTFTNFNPVYRKMDALNIGSDGTLKYTKVGLLATTTGFDFYTPLAIGTQFVDRFVYANGKFTDANGVELKPVERPSFTFPDAARFFEKNDQYDFASASPEIMAALEAYAKKANEDLKDDPLGYTYYGFMLWKGANIKEDGVVPSLPDMFASTVYSSVEKKLYLYETVDCKYTGTADDEAKFIFPNNIIYNRLPKEFRAVLTPFKNATKNMVIVPSEDYLNFTLVSRNDGSYVGLVQ